LPGKRIVLLQVSQTDVEAFVQRVTADGGIVTTTDDGELFTLEAKVEAVVAQPRVACRCATKRVEYKSRGARRKALATGRTIGWSRNAKLGWWVCPSCGYPSRAAVEHWITSMLAGANDLLPKLLGLGPAIDPQRRWERDGGLLNPHANADPHSAGIVQARDGGVVRRKTRRQKARPEGAIRVDNME